MPINLSRVKLYAPKARRDFIDAVANRAAKLGITEKGSLEAQVSGNVVIIGGQAYPRSVGELRARLLGRIATKGYREVIEQAAYTWFNRLAALRFMEIHEYLGHPYRVLSSPDDPDCLSEPEILRHATQLDFAGWDRASIEEAKLAGNREEEIYRSILIAQCNALNAAMPFLFEKIGDETELLLPDRLLATDGLIRKLVMSIPEADWEEIEIVGWLYQSYISEKKDQVFGALKKKKISAENIPAATQLFTPHWIVRYLVENSLGRLWLLNNHNSRLSENMDYYLPPEKSETDFLRISKPEEIRICDPACGSGHMLTYAFDLLHKIYEEKGYDVAEIPAMILKHNLVGLEIDDRAGALAAFALTMKAAGRLGRRRFLRMEVTPNIVVLQNVSFTAAEMKDAVALLGRDLFTDELHETLGQFEQAKNIGSLIVPRLRDPAETLRLVKARDFGGDLLLKELQDRVVSVLRMAEALSPKYHVVVANPPYMGGKGMNENLGHYAKTRYPDSKTDLFAMFIERALLLSKNRGMMAMINMQSWMFLSSFEKLRSKLLSSATILSMAHLGERGFDTIGGAVVSTTAFVLENAHHESFRGSYARLVDGKTEAQKSSTLKEIIANPDCGLFYRAVTEEFEKIPGKPIAYWVPEKIKNTFTLSCLGEKIITEGQNKTANNDKYLRQFWEVSEDKIGARKRWLLYAKGGPFRRWYGNISYVVDWSPAAVAHYRKDPSCRIIAEKFWYRPGVTWTDITTGGASFRYLPTETTFDMSGPAAFFSEQEDIISALSLLNSRYTDYLLPIFNPTLHAQLRDIKSIPDLTCVATPNISAIQRLIDVSREDWDTYETSHDFIALPLLSPDFRAGTLEATYARLRAHWQGMTDEMQRLEEENNRFFIEAYGLQGEMAPEVTVEEITLTCNPAYRYGLKIPGAEAESRLLEDTIKELISYSVGCLMGRYSLSNPGLVYANAGDEGFNPAVYGSFAACDDGIVPVTERLWFDDDAAVRFAECLDLVFGSDAREENLSFVSRNLSQKSGDAPVNTIRRYLSRSFYKDHLQTYSKRPIYWLFSSGPERAFECLVYLHRYNDRTLARMRAKYVTPLQSKMQNRLESLKAAAGDNRSSAVEKNRLREIDLLQRQLHELSKFDDRLRQTMDQNIRLDLDDGVRANYGKLRELLAEVDTVCGKKGEEGDE